MKVIIYSIKSFERSYLIKANKMNHELTQAEKALSTETAGLAQTHEAVVVFAGDDVSTPVIEKLQEAGGKLQLFQFVGNDHQVSERPMNWA